MQGYTAVFPPNYKGTNLCNFVCFPGQRNLSEKSPADKGKNFLLQMQSQGAHDVKTLWYI